MNDTRLNELMLVILGETPELGSHWLHPGATHHAGWMPSILYPAKMFAFSEQAGYDTSMVEKLEALCMFNSLLYVDKWLKASVGVDAPYNDLQLWHDLHEYRLYDEKVADAAIKALERNFWYLTEECAVFSMFSNRISNAERQQRARCLLKTRCPKEFEKGHPTFPLLNSSTKIIDLIGPKSWFLFRSMNVGTNWLGLLVSKMMTTTKKPSYVFDMSRL